MGLWAVGVWIGIAHIFATVVGRRSREVSSLRWSYWCGEIHDRRAVRYAGLEISWCMVDTTPRLVRDWGA